MRPVQGSAPVSGKAPVPGYYVRAPGPVQAARPVGVQVQSPVTLPRPVRWSVVPGAPPQPGHGVSVRPVTVVPKQPMQVVQPTQAAPSQPLAPSQSIHPMQVLGQSLVALATPPAVPPEPDTSDETRPESEVSSATSPVSPATGGGTASPAPDSPNTDPGQQEAAADSSLKGQPASALLEKLVGTAAPVDVPSTDAVPANGTGGGPLAASGIV